MKTETFEDFSIKESVLVQSKMVSLQKFLLCLHLQSTYCINSVFDEKNLYLIYLAENLFGVYMY